MTDIAKIETLLAAGNIAGAAAIAEQAIGEGTRTPMLLNLAAWRREEDGDFAGALALLEQARLLVPGDPSIDTALGTVLRKEGRIDAAIAAFDTVLARHPGYAVAWLERGFAFDAANRFAPAANSFRQAVGLDPNLAPAFAGLAWIAAVQGDHEKVGDYADRALAIDPRDATAHSAIAHSEIEQGLADIATSRLRSLLGRGDLPPARRLIALGLLGDALDRRGATDEAFAAWQEANAVFLSLNARQYRNQPTHRSFVEHILAQVRGLAPMVRLPAASTATMPRRHIFLLGYPRSGTTLVENILASADDVDAIEEQPTLNEAAEAFLLDDNGLSRLASLDAASIETFRQSYWARVEQAGVVPDGRVLVDMDPLKSVQLPLIARLFPDARIVIMRRDPRDVVWSCFRRSFAPSTATIEFTDIERIARHYAAVMELIEACQETMPINVHIVSHDRLVADFDTETAVLCEFVGIEWSERLREFSRTAQRRGVATASAPQVRRGLFNANGDWRRYARHLEAAMPILQPWIERFGYAP
jgi:tetratricopeptide (TPR) repeat protein